MNLKNNFYLDTIFYQSLYMKFKEAIEKYNLIDENDKILVCISGGKDSMLMAKLFEMYSKENKTFSIVNLVMDPGYNKLNLDLIKHNLSYLEIDALIQETNIFEVATTQLKNPCFLCARMRRGALYNIAKIHGCNKISLGHHFDDVVVTNLMNLVNSGSFQTMLPKLHSTNFEGIDLIRPMYLIEEENIIKWKDKNNINFIQCACKLTEGVLNHESTSQRHQTKLLIKEMKKDYPNIEKSIFESSDNVYLDHILGIKESEFNNEK